MSSRDAHRQVYARAKATLAPTHIRLRTARGWTQEEAAARCGMNTDQYGALERRQRNATLETLAKIADGYGVTMAALIAE